MFGNAFGAEQTPVLGVPTVSCRRWAGDHSSVETILRLLLYPHGDSLVQDLITYVLLAGFIAAVAAAFFPVATAGLSGTVFTR